MEMAEEDDIPSIFGDLLDEEESERDSSSSLAHDAYGLLDTSISGCPTITHPNRHLTKEAVITELQNLEYYEKVSLAFLLYDDVNYILQNLMIAERARLAGSLIPVDVLSPWITLQKDSNWERKLLEALCIIQNYEMLHKLGYDVDDAKLRFLPHTPESSLSINCMKKCLYHICESLDATSLEKLAKRVQDDFSTSHNGEELEVFDAEYMEINILNWSSRKYISLGDKHGRGVDVHRLKTQLKGMGEINLVEKLESSVRATVNASMEYTLEMNTSDNVSLRSSSTGSMTDTRSEPSSIFSQHSVASSCDQMATPANNEYYVDPRNVGYCVIINQKNFYQDSRPCLKNQLPDHELEPRLGTDVDRDRLSEAFNSLGFTVWVGENLDHERLQDSLASALEYRVRQEHSCFALCILSHGVEGAVYGNNSIPVSVDDLKKLMENCPKLLGKPKVIIIQACQGQIQQDAVDIAVDGPVSSRARSSDCLIFWSTVPGFASFRHEIDGTWFIQAICQHLLSSSPTDDLFRLFTYVNNQVCSKRANVSGEFKTMVPYFTSTLTKFLYLPLHPGAKVKVVQRMFERHMANALMREYIASNVLKQIELRKMKSRNRYEWK